MNAQAETKDHWSLVQKKNLVMQSLPMEDLLMKMTKFLSPDGLSIDATRQTCRAMTPHSNILQFTRGPHTLPEERNL